MNFSNRTDSFASPDETPQDEPQSMSLLGGIARPAGLPDADDFDVDGEPGKSVNRHTLMLILVVLIAAGTLYGMRLAQTELGKDSATQAAETKIENALAKWTAPATMAADDPLRPEQLQGLSQDTAAILQILSMDFSDRQVPIEYVQKNPFALGLQKPVAAATNTGEAERARAALLERLRREAQGMELQSVMGSGGRPIAVINGELVQTGQALGSFTVTAIDPKTMVVTLTAGGEQFTLTMQK